MRGVERLLGVSYRSLSDWEQSKLSPTIKTMPKIIQFIGYDPFEDASPLSDRRKNADVPKTPGA